MGLEAGWNCHISLLEAKKTTASSTPIEEENAQVVMDASESQNNSQNDNIKSTCHSHESLYRLTSVSSKREEEVQKLKKQGVLSQALY